MLRRAVFFGLLALLAQSLLGQTPIGVSARVATDEVYTGQSFLLELNVQGSDSPEAPDLSALASVFTIQDAGGGSRNSQSISIINGSISRQVERGYTFRYQLVARRPGTMTIPAIEVPIDGRTYRTEPIEIQVSPPTEVNDFKLRMSLTSTSAYVGQPLLLTTTWYIGRNVDQVAFEMPFLDDGRFEITDLPLDRSGQQDNLLEIAVSGRKVVAKRATSYLNGREFLTVSFTKVVTPKRPGRFELPASTASFRAVNTVSRAPRGYGGIFQSPLFNRTVYEDLAIPSNRPVLEISDLPTEGRPANFSGLVGSFEISAAATPTEVRVGDPISLEVAISGPEYLDYVRLPHLSETPGMSDSFRIPGERAQGEMRGNVKVFNQAIRAKSVEVTEIPAIALNYFDPETGGYETARTAPIPISVDATRMLTSADLGDLGPAVEQGDNQAQGPAPNVESDDALRARGSGVWAYASGAWLAAVAAPPLVVLALLGLRRLRAGKPEQRINVEAAHALDELRALTTPSADDVSRLLREYLGAKLGMRPFGITYADVEKPLAKAGADTEVLASVGDAFRACDEARFAGASGVDGLDRAAVQACERVEMLEALL